MTTAMKTLPLRLAMRDWGYYSVGKGLAMLS